MQTKQGKITVAVQRGTVTATDGKSVAVKSSDGFAQTWMYAAKVTIRKDHKKAEASAISVGATVGIAGVKTGGTCTARVIVVG